MEASPAELLEAVREQVSRASSRSGAIARTNRVSARQSGQKVRVLQRRNFVIVGYTPAGQNFDTILIGDYVGRTLQFVAQVHGGFTPSVRNCSLQAIPRARNEDLPVQEPARGTPRSWAKDWRLPRWSAAG